MHLSYDMTLVLELVHKQMYRIQTNLRMLKVTLIQMVIFHYIIEYVGNLCSPCPLYEQPKSTFLGPMQYSYVHA